ncbi:amino acid adenylation domain-containing protein [Flavitalea sp. BT771]|uniref:non-ribosomal peptide synthetase n=1 Tax=Flavitalea sp. BT771 TaxID=3063329 RepID=UPI0026E1E3E7|nr:non-ribosomal peptide synthetase [Flavitalea sp. BT771]MDO6435456.1 amino acid adenylation domain-containing protein [Flavitalea sp. BT771]MDV6224184.1 amino acid adenylation domain-containing protein [Flavitalea sp. BT771]
MKKQKRLPISEYQKMFFLEWVLAPDAIVYNISIINKLTGNIDEKLLKRACELFVNRNEVVHAQYSEDGESCYYGEFSIDDFFYGSTLRKDMSVQAQIRQLQYEPFDLTKGPLLRIHLVRNEDENNPEFYFFFVAHHIICDANWALQFFLQVQSAYNRLSTGEGIVAECHRTFTQAVEAERKVLNAEYKKDARQFWLELIADIPLAGNLPYRTNPDGHSLDDILSDKTGEFNYFQISALQTSALRLYAMQKETTVFIVLSALYGLVLSRFICQERFLFSYTVNTRAADFKEIAGCFVNNIPMKFDLSTVDTIDELVESLEQQRKRAKRYQGYSFLDIIQDQRKYNQCKQGNVFNIGFSQTYLNAIPFELHGLKSLPVDISWSKNSLHEIGLFYDDRSSEIKFMLEFRKSLFDTYLIQQLIDSFQRAISELVVGRKILIRSYSVVGPAEYHQLVYEWNRTEKVYARDKTLHTLFEEQVVKTPEAVALIFEDQQLTYKDLNEKCNQLACYIRKQYRHRTKQELQADTLIALCVERSLEMVVGILAVLKAGGAYVPIDPSYPAQRIGYILDDTGAALVMTQRHLQEKKRLLPQEKAVYIDLNEAVYQQPAFSDYYWPGITKANDQDADASNLPRYSNAQNLAYVLYTSGTTGNPKGVMLTHSGIVNRLEWMQSMYPLSDKDVVLQKTPYVFDVSVWELLWANWYGGKIVLAQPEGHKDSGYLHRLMEKHEVTTVHFVPSMLEGYTQYLKDHGYRFSATLRRLFCSGEALSGQVVCQAYARAGNEDLKLHNLYGPTEASIDVTFFETRPDGKVCIGRPIQNTQAFVLDNNLQPVPIGVTGELYIGGAGLARGYLNNALLTSERFIQNPFATEKDTAQGHTRLYRTGDLVRWLPGGELAYLGRNDEQVKLRGYRIEPGEIEAAMNRVAGVRQSCVVIKERATPSGSTKYLVGYYVADRKVTAEALSAELSAELPEYMVPAALVGLESFPLTANGKLDRRALPDAELRSAEEYVAPGTETEIRISHIWAELLGVERVGITEDFFKLGGDSILGIQLAGRLRQAGWSCQVKDIFSYKTIERLTQYLSKAGSDPLLQSEQGNLTGSFGLLPVQEWFRSRMESGRLLAAHHWNQSFLLRVPSLELDKLEEMVEDLVGYHDALRLRYVRGAQWTQQYQASMSVPAVRRMDIRGMKDEAVEAQLTAWQSGFDLWAGPLFQVGYLYGYEDGSARLFMSLHHLICDVVSWRILAEDLRRLYEGKALGLKGSSYRQWVATVQAYRERHRTEAHYWQKQLEGQPAYGSLLGAPGTACAEVGWTKAQTELLIHQAPAAYHTQPHELLLTALAYALQSLTGSSHQVITLEGHGREEIDASIDHSRTVGWFTSLFPMKLELQATLPESIRWVKERLRSIPNKGIGFGVFAVEASTPYGYDDLPPIIFNYLGQLDGGSSGEWQLCAESSGVSIGRANDPANLIEMNGAVRGGELSFSIVTQLGKAVTAQLSQGFKTQLTAIIGHCMAKLEQEGCSYTPSDFYHALNEGDLSNLPIIKNPLKMYEPFAMTDIQKAYLLGRLNTFEIGGISNHIYHEFKFLAAIDIPRLENVINSLVRNYPELRTVFDIESLTQRYLHVAETPRYNIEVNKYNCDYSDDLLISTRASLSHYVYDAGKFPLYTFQLSRFADCDILHVSIDLILLDVESRQNFFAEITKLYEDDLFTPTPPKIHFKDYQDYVEFLRFTQWYANDKKYWHHKLDSLPLRPQLSLKVDPETISTPRFDFSARVIEELVWTKFKAKAIQHDISISSALVSLFGYVLSRYAGSNEFLITLTTFNRYSVHPDVNSIFGDFTSTSLFGYKGLRGSIKENLSLSHQDLWNDLSHGLFNGVQVQRELRNLRKLNHRQAVSPIVFTSRIGNTEKQPKNAGQYFLTKYEDKESRAWQAQTSQAWIDLQALESGNQLHSRWMYVEQLFDREFIEKLNSDYCQLIEYVSQTDWNNGLPENGLRPRDHSLITAANSQYQEQVSDTLISICLASIKQGTDGPAVIDATGTYTYQEIGAYEYKIACYLNFRALSKPGYLIGMLSEKGFLQVVSCLGIMHSGAAYLPLNIEWPLGRINEVLEEGLVKTVLISQSEFNCRVKNSEIERHYEWLVIEDIINHRLEASESEITVPKPEDVAYVIFTSGSTGKPKGVTIAHRSAVNTILAVNHRFHVNGNDKVLALSELSFDLSVYDIFGVLAAGGTIVFPDQKKSRQPDHWLELISQHGITIWNTVPQLMQLLVDCAIDPGDLKPIRVVMLSGDWIPLRLPGQIRRFVPDVVIMSLGGATEGSIWSIWYEIKSIDPGWDSIPYGYAMPNQKMYVLNEYLEHCPIGVTGQVHIGGDGVALGYWNDVDKTNARFIRHKRLGRLYKTGDLGKWDERGYMLFEGRTDSQVKLNGYRVELTEISSKLIKIPGVENALITVRNGQLTAYVILERGDEKKDKITKEGFILEQIGVRKDLSPSYKLGPLSLDENKYRLRKSYRQFLPGKLRLVKEDIERLISSDVMLSGSFLQERETFGEINNCERYEIDVLKKILSVISAIKLENRLLPKYLYPSAGSTNAIQCYVCLDEDMDNGRLKKGCYYYEPVSHYLAAEEGGFNADIAMDLQEHRIGKSRIVLRFRLYKPASEPIYGDMCTKLAWIETGHVVKLIEQQMHEAGLNGEIKIMDHEKGRYHDLVEISIDLNADGKEKLPKCLISEEKNARPSIDYLCRDRQKFRDAEGHEYSISVQNVFGQASEVNQLLTHTQGLIVFYGSNDPSDLLKAGYQAQSLTERLCEINVGSCVLGFIPYEGVVYSIAIGEISGWHKSLPEILLPQTSLRVYLNQFIGQDLPEYMLPSQYVILDELPLTANGKVDYKNLPDAAIVKEVYAAPTSETEMIICNIWQEMLNLEKVGVTDDFFEIGGNSILATKVSNKMSRDLGCNVMVADIFKLKNIKTLTKIIAVPQVADAGVEWEFGI